MADDIPPVIGSSLGSAADDAHLDAAVRVTLPWVAGLLAVAAAAAAAVSVSTPNAPGSAAAAVACAAAAVLLLALAGVAHRWRDRLPVADAWASGAVVVAAAAGVVSVVVTDDISWSLLVMVAVAAAGSAVVTMRWLIAVLYAVWVGWLAGLAAAELTGAVVWLAALAAVTGLAVVASVTRRHLVEALTAAEATVDQVSVRDPLTGLVNRRGLALLGVQIVEAARRQGDAVHCVFVDIDQLRHVNEMVSHEAGDDVLVAVGDALRSATRSTDVVARWGGDEFCIIGPGAGTAPMELERRVRERVMLSPPVPDEIWSPRVVAGGAMLAPWDSGSLDTLLGKADQEMYLRRALRRGGGSRPRPSASQREQATGDAGG